MKTEEKEGIEMNKKLFALTFVLLFCALGFSNIPVDCQEISEEAEETLISADAIQGWWETSTEATRVGEEFSLVLTLKTALSPEYNVVVDTMMLDEVSINLAPYEVRGVERAQPVFINSFRLDQYIYKLVIIGEDVFGQEIPVPEYELKYHIEHLAEGDIAVSESEQIYILPELSMQVLSVVPPGADDIRDRGSLTFSSLDERRHTARLVLMLAVMLAIIPFGLGLWGIITHFRKEKKVSCVKDGTIGDVALFIKLWLYISRLKKRVISKGWTNFNTSNFKALIRVLAAIASNRSVHQNRIDKNSHAVSGNVYIPLGFSKMMAVNSTMTHEELKIIISRDSFTTDFSEDARSAIARLSQYLALNTEACKENPRDELYKLEMVDDLKKILALLFIAYIKNGILRPFRTILGRNKTISAHQTS